MTKIASKEREFDAVKQTVQIRARAGLTDQPLPAFARQSLETLLGRTIEGVAADAERRVMDQIQTHATHARGQAWLSEGLAYVQNNTCAPNLMRLFTP